MVKQAEITGGRNALIGLIALGFATFAFLLWGLLGWLTWSAFSRVDFGTSIPAFFWQIIANLTITLPLLLGGIGFGALRIAIGLWGRRQPSYRWALTLLSWTLIIGALLLYAERGSGALTAILHLPEPSRLDLSLILVPMLIISGVLLLTLFFIRDSFANDRDAAKLENNTAWQFLLPSLVILGFLGGYPIEQITISSFSNEVFGITRETEFVGLDNYERLLNIRIDSCARFDSVGDCEDYIFDTFIRHDIVYEWNIFGTTYFVSSPDAKFLNALWDTIVFTFVSVTLELILGLMLAQVLVVKFRGVSAMRLFALIPYAVPTIVSTLFWDVMLSGSRSGLLNQVMIGIGAIDAPVSWLTNRTWQLPMLIFVDVWKTTPYMAFFLIPGLLIISKDVYEAAAVDGAGRIRQFFSITLPMTMPFIGVAVLFRALNAIRVFDVFQLLVGERRFSLASYTQDTLIDGNMGYSSATGVFMFVIITILVYFYLRTQRIQAE